MKKLSVIFVFVVVLALLLVSCETNGKTAPTATVDTQATQLVDLQSQIATLKAPTATPALTATLEPTATLAATETSAPIVAAGTNCGDKTLQTLYLTVVNPGVASQPQIGHPSAYAETHVSDIPVCVVIDVPEGYKAIVGGVTVDKLTNGVYQGYGPGHIETIVTNGFALITTDGWAKAEWDFRIQQTVTYGWAHAHVDSGPIQ